MRNIWTAELDEYPELIQNFSPQSSAKRFTLLISMVFGVWGFF